jgi:hypothetical protein
MSSGSKVTGSPIGSDTLLALCDQLEASLSATADTRRLLDAQLAQALESPEHCIGGDQSV